MKKNTVVGKSILTLPSTTLYNSDAIERTVGIWRYAGGGIIEQGYYDYKTHTLGPYKFVEPYTYVPTFYSEIPTPSIRILYQTLLETKTALAAIFVNNSFVCLLYPDGLKYIGLGEDYYDFKSIENLECKKMIDCGWVKTYLDCADVARLPYKLQMDLTNGLVYMGKGEWVKPPGFPAFDKQPTYPMYKRLLEHENVRAVMYDSISDKEVYF